MSLTRKVFSGDFKLFLNIISTFILKGLALIVSFFSTPLYIKYFNNDEVLGFWYTILAVLNFINIFDLGLGNGLRNHLTIAYENDEKEQAKGYISSAYFIVFFLTIFIFIIGIIMIFVMDFNNFFGIDVTLISSTTMRNCLLLLLITILLNFFLKLINSILYAIQLPALNNVTYLITSVLIFIYVLVAKSAPNVEINLMKFSVVNLLAMNLPLLIVTILIFSTKLKYMKPAIKYINKLTCKKMFQLSLNFFFAQISFMALVSTNELFITRLYGPDRVVEYNIYYKIFTVIGSLIVLALGPVWSYITKLIANKEFKKIKKYNTLLNFVIPVTLIIQLIIVIMLKFIFKVWLRENVIEVNYFYAIIFAFYGTIYVYNCVVTTIANSFGKVITQIIFYSIGFFIKFLMLILISEFNNNWIFVLIIVSLILFVFCVFQSIWTNRIIKKNITIGE